MLELAKHKNGLNPTAKDVAGILKSLRLLKSCINSWNGTDKEQLLQNEKL